MRKKLISSLGGSMGLAALVVMVVSGVVFGYISVVNHNRLMTFGWDLGFYDQMVWQVSRGIWPVTSFFESEVATWGIRFSPILGLVAPVYWVWADARILLVVQAVVAALGGWPMWWLAQRRFGEGKAGGLVGLGAVIAYVSFIGLQRAVFFDFHPDVVMAMLVGWLLVAVEKNSLKGSLAVAILILMCKEWAGLLVAGVGFGRVVEGWMTRDRREGWLSLEGLGWRLVVLGVVGFVVTIYGVAKPLAGIETSVFGYGAVGETPIGVMVTMVTRPWVVIRELVWPAVKLETVIGSLAAVGFLPLLAPVTLIPIGVQLAVRFLDGGHQQAWTMNYHYSATLTPLLVYGAIMGIGNIGNWQKNNVLSWRYIKWLDRGRIAVTTWGVGMGWLMVWVMGSMVYFHAPVFSILKPEYYREAMWIGDTREVLRLIPDGVAVAAQNNLVPHVSARSRIYPLPKIEDAEYVVVDLVPGQSSYNFSTATEEEVRELVERLVERGEFEWVEREGEAGVLRRRKGI